MSGVTTRTAEDYRDPVTGRYEAFDTYSTRQAIEEKFILDVLASYVTYQTFWNIEKSWPRPDSMRQ
jgi:hypothetical protein